MACTHFKIPKRALSMSYFSATTLEFVDLDDETDYKAALQQPGE
jgi:hypothetical protein